MQRLSGAPSSSRQGGLRTHVSPAVTRHIARRCYGKSVRPAVSVSCLASVDSTSVLGEDLCWRTDFNRHYVKGKIIGTGSFGCVYLGIDLHTGQEVAVKVMPKVRGKLTKERTLEKLQREVDIVELLQDCRNVVRLENCFETDTEVLIVTELCSGGDLQKLSDSHGPFSERNVSLVAHEVLKVVKSCHENGYLHGDLKPANFVLKQKHKNPMFAADAALQHLPWLKAIDFGCSQSFRGAYRLTKRTGTPVYMAPEIFLRDYSCEADLWSLGVMLYQLYSRRFPFWDTEGGCKATSIEEVQKAVLDNEVKFNYGPWHDMSPEGLDFIQQCLQRDYKERFNVNEAMQHPWVKAIDRKAPVSNNIVPSLALVPKVAQLQV